MNAIELINKFYNSELITNGGSISVWGIPFGKVGDTFYKIIDIEYNELENILYIYTDYHKLKIWNPINIKENEPKNEFWPPILEIEDAERILLMYNTKNTDFFLDINFNENFINTNIKFYENYTNKDLEHPALIIG